MNMSQTDCALRCLLATFKQGRLWDLRQYLQLCFVLHTNAGLWFARRVFHLFIYHLRLRGDHPKVDVRNTPGAFIASYCL